MGEIYYRVCKPIGPGEELLTNYGSSFSKTLGIQKQFHNHESSQDAQSFEIQGDCAKSCPQVFSPVSGTDGKTYNNECELNVANCKVKGRKIQVAKPGPCEQVVPVRPTVQGPTVPAKSGHPPFQVASPSTTSSSTSESTTESTSNNTAVSGVSATMTDTSTSTSATSDGTPFTCNHCDTHFRYIH